MIKIGHLRDFDNCKNQIEDIFGKVIGTDSYQQLEVLDGFYGKDRDIYEDDGGYLVLLKDEEEWNQYNTETEGMLERNNYDLHFTFFDDSENFVRVDYLTNNETAITVYMPKELFKE